MLLLFLGNDVVLAVVQKIERSEIFENDFLFIRRLGYVQTNDGKLNLITKN